MNGSWFPKTPIALPTFRSCLRASAPPPPSPAEADAKNPPEHDENSYGIGHVLVVGDAVEAREAFLENRRHGQQQNEREQERDQRIIAERTGDIQVQQRMDRPLGPASRTRQAGHKTEEAFRKETAGAGVEHEVHGDERQQDDPCRNLEKCGVLFQTGQRSDL